MLKVICCPPPHNSPILSSSSQVERLNEAAETKYEEVVGVAAPGHPVAPAPACNHTSACIPSSVCVQMTGDSQEELEDCLAKEEKEIKPSVVGRLLKQTQQTTQL